MSTYQAGQIVKGKVTGIKEYGAFIKLHHTQGLVHISEITNGYVKDIHSFLMIGDEVHVKVLSVDDESGKVSLSLKGVEEQLYKKKHRFLQVPKPKGNGFRTLKKKLPQWIAEAEKVK